MKITVATIAMFLKNNRSIFLNISNGSVSLVYFRFFIMHTCTPVLAILSSMILLCNCNTKQTKSKKDLMIIRYADSFSLLAKAEMKRTAVPASIKLAQGILESKYGQSELALKANNHFGIKCGKKWEGLRYSVLSDEWDKKRKKMRPSLGCFRVYESVEDCFKAHSEFLKAERYSGLFELSATDYRGWAAGLQKAGYATDPKYAEKLIKLIESYRLFKYDAEFFLQF
jgi:flagellum-specific peptidoglycan hydrolase FlgJ